MSLKLYRTESRKIFKIARRYADPFEKASCDECFLDVTNEVNLRFNYLDPSELNDQWHNSKFMGFPKNDSDGSFSGRFMPESEED